MVTIWCSGIGVIRYSFLESNQILIADIYWDQLDGIHIQLDKLWSGPIIQRWPIVLHENARSRIVKMTLLKFIDNNRNKTRDFVTSIYSWSLTYFLSFFSNIFSSTGQKEYTAFVDFWHSNL